MNVHISKANRSVYLLQVQGSPQNFLRYTHYKQHVHVLCAVYTCIVTTISSVSERTPLVGKVSGTHNCDSTFFWDVSPLWVGEGVGALTNPLLHPGGDRGTTRAVERREPTQPGREGRWEGAGGRYERLSGIVCGKEKNATCTHVHVSSDNAVS
jgi:hypothetical protein